MSYFEDYIADGLCCQCCGVYLDDGEPGYPRSCSHCSVDAVTTTHKKTKSQKRNEQRRRAKARKQER